MPSPLPPIDNAVLIVTPENIAFQYRVAGPFHRLLAYLVDLLVRLLVGVGVLLVTSILFSLAHLPLAGLGVGLIAWFLLAWFYGGAFEALWNGQTPGKRLYNLRVLSQDGQSVSGFQAVLRNVLRAVDMLPLPFVALAENDSEWLPLRFMGVYMVGLLAAAMNDRFQRLGDLVCGTIVVIEERPWFAGLLRITDPEALRLAGLIPANFQPSRALARALAVYVQRRGNFPALRRAEIARHVAEPLRARFGLPPATDPDLLLCAVYQRAFIAEHNGAPTRQRNGTPAKVRPESLGSPLPEAVGPLVQTPLPLGEVAAAPVPGGEARP